MLQFPLGGPGLLAGTVNGLYFLASALFPPVQ